MAFVMRSKRLKAQRASEFSPVGTTVAAFPCMAIAHTPIECIPEDLRPEYLETCGVLESKGFSLRFDPNQRPFPYLILGIHGVAFSDMTGLRTWFRDYAQQLPFDGYAQPYIWA
jgi:hypothetical protein